jgi:hypothetical protein
VWLSVDVVTPGAYPLQVTVAAPWSVLDSDDECGATEVGQCVVLAPTEVHRVIVATSDTTALSRNVRFEVVDFGTTCP